MNTFVARVRNATAGKLQQDILWNLGSLVIVGVGGILLFCLIKKWYGDEALGIFNQTYAAFIVFSQFAVGGVHLSVLKYIAEEERTRHHQGTIIVTALLLTVALAALFTLLFWFSRGWISAWLESPGVGIGMAWATPGLFCFALNKTLLGSLNGLRRMRLYAVAQALRPILWIVSFCWMASAEWPAAQIPFLLTAAEVAVTLVLLVGVAPWLTLEPNAPLGGWVRRHGDFGVRSFGSGALTELNTRIDALMLGVFLSDALVGIYSFVAVLVEGFGQVAIVLRNNFNPLLARYLTARDDAALTTLVRKGRWVALGLMAGIAIVALPLFPIGYRFVASPENLSASWLVFTILLTGLVISAGYLPFGQLLLQAGKPATHTFMILTVVLFNAAANAAMIPWLGLNGAAIATAASFLFAVILLRILAKRIVGVSI